MKKLALVSLAAAATIACSSSDEEGTASFTVWGEEYIEQAIPAEEFEDGWTVVFDEFLVVVSDVSVAEAGKPAAATMAAPKIFDLRVPGEKAVATFAGLPARAYDHVSYAISPATPDAELGEGATEAQKQRMLEGGYSILLSATATKGATSKRFTWGFSTSTLYDLCQGELSGKRTDGVVVTNGGEDTAQLTMHADHLFYDDLQAPDAKLRFDTIASADADDDGTITLEELAKIELASIPKEQGPYGTGSASGIVDLRGFVEALTRTIGHFRGEGECVSRPR